MKTLLLGMGNPILSDDAIGVRLAVDFKGAVDRLQATRSSPRKKAHPSSRRSQSILASAATAQNCPAARATAGSSLLELDIIEECSVGGLNLLDLLRGYERVIVLDSLQTSEGTPGTWHRFTADRLRETVHLTSLHDANFATALELGRRIGLPLPDDTEIHIFAVEIQDNRTFSEQMTPALEQAYPGLRAAIFQHLQGLLPISTASPSQN